MNFRPDRLRLIRRGETLFLGDRGVGLVNELEKQPTVQEAGHAWRFRRNSGPVTINYGRGGLLIRFLLLALPQRATLGIFEAQPLC